MNVFNVDDLGDLLCQVTHNNLDQRRTAVPLHRACPEHLGQAVAVMNKLGEDHQ